MTRNSEYLLPDGSPRYGIRIEEAARATEPAAALPPLGLPADLVAEASGLDLTQLRAAIDLRYAQAWADEPDDRIREWRDEHPREALEAIALILSVLGRTTSRWMSMAFINEGEVLRPVLKRRREARTGAFRGKAGLLARVALFLAPIAALVQGAGTEVVSPLVVLFLVARVPLREGAREAKRIHPVPEIQSGGLYELREDLMNAVMVSSLLHKGEEVPDDIRHAAERGWRLVRHAAAGVDAVRRGPQE